VPTTVVAKFSRMNTERMLSASKRAWSMRGSPLKSVFGD
jgi:hypothetical protein